MAMKDAPPANPAKVLADLNALRNQQCQISWLCYGVNPCKVNNTADPAPPVDTVLPLPSS